jgi:hypothetical protein
MLQKLFVALAVGLTLAVSIVYALTAPPASAAPPVDEPGAITATPTVTPTLRAFVDPRPRKEAVLVETHGSPPPDAPDVSIAAAPASATWWVYDHFAMSSYQRTFTLKHTSNTAYIYADATVPLATAQTLGTNFDAVYSSVTGNFGSPPNVDGEPRIFLLLTDIRDDYYYNPSAGSYVACYFDPAHEHAGTNSNLREMLFVDLSPGSPASTQTYRCLAHQLALMVAHNYDTNEETWLEDGLGSLAEYGAGYGHRAEVEDFLKSPDRPLTTWQGNTVDVGKSYLWALYLKERYGQTKVKQILQHAANGMSAVQTVLGVPPATLMRNWAVANFLDDLSRADYRYAGLSIVASGADRVTKFTRPPYNKSMLVGYNPTTLSGSLSGPYAAQYISVQRFDGSSLQITDKIGQHETFLYDISASKVQLDWSGVFTSLNYAQGDLGVLVVYSAPPPASNNYQYELKSYIDLKKIYLPVVVKNR